MRHLEIIGHRGARGDVAENTPASFAFAYASGVDGVELDIGMTADGVLVVFHDRCLSPALVRDGDGRWLESEGPSLFSLRRAALDTYDVGQIAPDSEYAERFPMQTSVDGARIPTLGEILDMTFELAGTALSLVVEVKTSPQAPHETAAPEVIAEQLVEVICGRGMEGCCVIESFDWRVMNHVHIHSSAIHTAFLTAQRPWLNNVENPGWTGGLDLRDYQGSVPDLVAAAGGEIWVPFFRDINERSLERAHSLGQRVLAWTVNEPEDMQYLIGLGVDGIITDYPQRLRAVASELGFSLPPKMPANAEILRPLGDGS